MCLIVLLVLAVGPVYTGFSLAETEIEQLRSTRKEYLLPNNLKPLLYQIELEPDFETEIYRGSINITFSTESTTNVVVFHKNQLEIDDSSISLLDSKENKVNSVANTSYSEDDKHFYKIIFKENLREKEVYTLIIYSFTNRLILDKRRGFYLGNYRDENGVIKKFCVTHFEPTAAREAFPCFDEPALKAQFEITIIRPAGYNSISNMPKISETEISEGRFRDKFERSVTMSTYLIAFVISDFTNISHLNQRVFGRPASIAANQANFALDMGVKILNTMSETVNIPYTLAKMDQVGIPSSMFFGGAMENWGLVIYNEKSLMYSGKSGSYGITNIISHEFAHQWFGNLVSPSWWSYIWLNEGFATYFSYYISAKVLNDPKLMNLFVPTYLHGVLNVDSNNGVTSMNHEVGSPNDVAMHLHNAYSKPSSVIRMVHHIISTEMFLKGLNIYLNKMQFRAAHPEDLYSSWQQALDEGGVDPFPDNENMSSVMRTWDSNAGYPLITVHRNYSNGFVIISQRRFLRKNPNNNDESIWYVPITYTTGSNMNFSVTPPKLWLTTRSVEVVLDDLKPADWLIVNIQQTGFYRVNYDNENWKRIINFLKSDVHKIDEVSKGQLQSDAHALFGANLIDGSIYEGIVNSIKQETAYIPLRSFINTLDSLDIYFSNTKSYKEFKKMILDLLETSLNSVGFQESDDDSYVTQLKRDMLLTWACKYGREECKEYGLANIRKWNRKKNGVIITDLHTHLLCAALRDGEQDNWDFVFNLYMTEDKFVVRERLLKALSCTENEDALERFLDVAIHNTSYTRESDRLSAFVATCNSGTYGRNYLYTYCKKNWKDIRAILPIEDFKSVIKCIANKFSTEGQLAEMQDLLELSGTRSSSEDILRTTQSNIEGTRKFVPTIINWISENRFK